LHVLQSKSSQQAQINQQGATIITIRWEIITY